VLDAATDLPVARAVVSVPDQCIEAVTDEAGRFALPGAEAATDVVVTSQGYGTSKLTLREGSTGEEATVRLLAETVRLTDEVSVTAPTFEPRDPAAPGEQTVAGDELRSLADTASGDPLRAVQSLPGVASADDFDATFAARGASFAHAGFYLDGVLLSSPFHTVRDANRSFSVTVVNGDVVDSVALINGGAPARYGDRTGPVLNVITREGRREGFAGRVSLGSTGAYATLEGPLDAAGKRTWLASVRRSYVGYMLRQLDSSGMGVDYADLTAKLTDHRGPWNTLALTFVHGQSRWDEADASLAPGAIQRADAGTDLASLRWRRLSSGRVWGETVAFMARETGRNRTADEADRLQSVSTQAGLASDWGVAARGHRLEAGIVARQLAEDVVARRLDRSLGSYGVTKSYAARDWLWGGYVQDGFAPARRLRLTLGARIDAFDATRETRLSPRASIEWTAARTTLRASLGAYSQFPTFDQLYGQHANPDLAAERSTQLTVGIEQSLGPSLRARVEAYGYAGRSLAFSPATHFRIFDGRITSPDPDVPWQSSARARSRGVEVLLQRRSPRGVTGWIAYSLGSTRISDAESGLSFDGDQDQRHAVTAFGTCRLGGTLSLATRFRYGSGFPVPGYYQPGRGGVSLSGQRNLYRPGDYSRWDVRASRTFSFSRWRLTAYAEILNVLDRDNERYGRLIGVDVSGRVFLEDRPLLPRLPSIGVTADF
jgi:hypothetical protein